MTGGETRIRPAVPADAPEIARVHVQTWRNTYASLIDHDYLAAMNQAGQTKMWRRQIASPGPVGAVLVAEAPGAKSGAGSEPGRVVGFGNCGRRREAPGAFQAEIYTLYVEVDWQGRGLGRGLLAGMFEALCRDGLNSAFLWVLAGNPTRFFYEAMGGEAVAERTERFAGQDLEELAYGWADLAGWLDARR